MTQPASEHSYPIYTPPPQDRLALGPSPRTVASSTDTTAPVLPCPPVIMEALPVELIRLIFGHCDPASVRSLREVKRIYAAVGAEYLLDRSFTSIGWGMDIDHLYNIAHHERLKPYIQRVVLNFSEVDKRYPRCHQIHVNEKLTDQYSRLHGAMRELPSLTEVDVAFTRAPRNNKVLKEKGKEAPSCRKLDHAKAADYLNAVISALDDVKIQSLRVDWFPFELFRHPEHRRHWFRFESSLVNLRTLDLVLDPELTAEAPHTHLVAVNGLGRILRVCKNLTSLFLAFRNGRHPRIKTRIWFSELIGDDFTYPQLADLKLEGLNCAEGDLTEFLVRHAPTLKRLRLGGRGLAAPEEPSVGGMQLCRGQWRYFFAALRKGMSGLERLHLEGGFASLNQQSPQHESYLFHPTTDDAWDEVDPSWQKRATSIHSLGFERYVLHGEPYPGTS